MTNERLEKWKKAEEYIKKNNCSAVAAEKALGLPQNFISDVRHNLRLQGKLPKSIGETRGPKVILKKAPFNVSQKTQIAVFTLETKDVANFIERLSQ